MKSHIQERIAAADIGDARLRQSVEAWHRLRLEAGGIPERRLIDPFAVPELVDSLALYDVGDDGQIRFRIVGERIKAALNTNPVGRTLLDVVGDSAYGRFVAGQLDDCVAAGLPVFSHHDFRRETERVVREAKRIALPYGESGRIRRLLCFQIMSEALRPWEEATEVADWHVIRLAFVDRI